MTEASLALGVTFLVSLGLTRVLRAVAPFLGLMDRPDPRKVHSVPTPRAGGLAILLGLLAAYPWHPVILGWLPWSTVLTAVVGISLLGLIDDLYPLPWWLRLGVQALVAGVLVADFPGLDFPGGRFLAGFWLVALLNAFNMLDNMDALSAGTAWIACLAFLALTLVDPQPQADVTRVTLLMLGAIAGFLVQNWPPARIFMGDAGSTLLGLLVGLLGLVVIDHTRGSLQGILAVLVICAVPLYDQVSVVLLRLSQGRSPFHADRQHLSHRISSRGWSRPAAVFWIHGLALANGVVGVLLYTQPRVWALTAALLVLLGWLLLAGYEFAPRRRQN